MTCTSCGEKPKKCSCHSRDFPSAVVEINNPEQLVLLRKVLIPSSLPEADNPPAIGKYRNVILKYEDTGNVYIYSSDGIPTAIEANVPQEILDKITNLEEDIETEETRRISADDALRSSINTVSGNLSAEISARQSADTAIRSDLTTLTGRVTTAEGDIDIIEGKIPNQATAQNQLADKNFVNSSIATNTANFIGTFNSVAELEAYSGTVTNNDYAFVIVTDAQGNTAYDRYKYSGDTQQWMFEYELNNSSFTAEQWAAINSGITSGNVDKLTGLANIKTIGANLNLSQAGELSATDTTYSNFVGTDGTSAGTSGLVPAPATTDAGKVLGANGSWVTGGPTVVQTTGTSTADVMSQNAVSSLIFGNISTNDRIHLGNTNAGGDYTVSLGLSAVVSGQGGTALGASAKVFDNEGLALGHSTSVSHASSVALGAGAKTSVKGEVNIGTSNMAIPANYGYNNSSYRLLSGVYDPQSAHDAATKGYVDTTVAASATPVVQATGTSTTDVMSQNATTSMVFADPSSTRQVQIGNGALARGTRGIAIGAEAMTYNNKHYAIAIGSEAKAGGTHAMGIGKNASAAGDDAIAFGAHSTSGGTGSVSIGSGDSSTNGAKAQGDRSIAIGYGAKVTTTSGTKGQIALGAYSEITNSTGTMNIGSTNTDYGYNSSNYRLLTGLYDPQGAHDAATKGYCDNATVNGGTTAPTTATVGAVGTQYTYVDTSGTPTAHLCVCVAVDTSVTPNTYTWQTLI